MVWVLRLRPQSFGFARSRWTCAAVALVLREDHGSRVGREAVRRALRGAGLVCGRGRPVLLCRDPDRAASLAALRGPPHGLSPDETAVFIGRGRSSHQSEGDGKAAITVLAGEQADGQREPRAVVGAGAEGVGGVRR